MKNYLLLSAFLLGTFSLHSQTMIGLKGGFNLAHVASNNAAVNNHNKPLPFFHAGLLADFRVAEGLYFQPHVLFQGKGTILKYSNTGSSGTSKEKVRFYTLDIPLNLVYRSENGFFAGAGPNFGFNLSASSKFDGEVEGIDLGSEPGKYDRFDFGINFLAGYQTPMGLFASVNYIWGISNLDNTPDYTWHNNVFGISVGYMWGRRNNGGTNLP